VDAANNELNEEIKIDANNASAEFMLGEIARQAGQWDEAAGHFSRASKLDEGFVEAYLAPGISLNSSEILHDADWNACNSFENPDRVIPKLHGIRVNGSSLQLDLPRLSVVTATVPIH
jgi:tetratricopeptide (TPR) repeat protein